MEEHIEAVQRMQDYIQENLNKEITMADLARASMYSPWYSYRLFVQLLNNPYEYSLSPVPIYLFKPYGVKYAKIRKDTDMKEVKNVFVQVIEKPERKVIIKRGKEAKDYWKYCEEVGCDVPG